MIDATGNANGQRWVSCHAAASRLGVSVKTVRRMIRKGVFVSRKLNGYRYQIREDTLERAFTAGPSWDDPAL
jgi:excisionase family DNA binding protein